MTFYSKPIEFSLKQTKWIDTAALISINMNQKTYNGIFIAQLN